MSAAWDPRALALVRGDRVRVRLSGECPGTWSNVLRKWMPHAEDAHGRVGILRDVHVGPCCDRRCGHGYAVFFGAWPDYGQFARAELEPWP